VVREALNHRLSAEALAEEMRVLYVAMTRARERLILVGSVRDLGSALQRWCSLIQHEAAPLPDAYLLEAASYLDLLGPCLARHRDGQPLRAAAQSTLLPSDRQLYDHPSRWEVHLWQAAEAVTLVAPAADRGAGLAAVWSELVRGRPVEFPAGEAAAAAAREVARDLARRLDWSLPWAPLGRLPAKTSVTELKWVAGGRTVDGVDAAEAAGDEEPAAPWPAGGRHAEPPRIHREDPASTPAADARWRGTIVHRVIQQLD